MKGASAHLKGRNFLVWALHVSGVPAADLGRLFGVGRQRAGKICKRVNESIYRKADHPWSGVDIENPPAWMARLEAAGAIPRHPGMTTKERREDAIQRHLDRLAKPRGDKFEPSPFEPPHWRLVVPSADDGMTITRQYPAPFVRMNHSHLPTSGPWLARYLENWWHSFLLGWWLVGELHVRIANAADNTLAFGSEVCRDEGQRLLDRAEFFDRELARRKR